MSYNPTNNAAVIYARVSSTTDRQNCARQIADLTRYAVANGLTVANTYTEHISGAKSNSERVTLGECLDYCEREGVGTLLISELSRLGRNTFEVLENVKRCRDHGLNIYFEKEQLSLFDREGKENIFLPVMIATLATCAQLERENIGFRLQSGRRAYIEAGGRVGKPVGAVKSREQKEKQYAKALRLLRAGESNRNTAALTGVSVSTIKRLRAEFEINLSTK